MIQSQIPPQMQPQMPPQPPQQPQLIQTQYQPMPMPMNGGLYQQQPFQQQQPPPPPPPPSQPQPLKMSTQPQMPPQGMPGGPILQAPQMAAPPQMSPQQQQIPPQGMPQAPQMAGPAMGQQGQQNQDVLLLWNKIRNERYAMRLIASQEQDYPGNNAKLHSGPGYYKTLEEFESHIKLVVETAEKNVGTPDALSAGVLKKTLASFMEERKNGGGGVGGLQHQQGYQQNPAMQFGEQQSQLGGAAYSPHQSFPMIYNYGASSTPQLTTTPSVEPQGTITKTKKSRKDKDKDPKDKEKTHKRHRHSNSNPNGVITITNSSGAVSTPGPYSSVLHSTQSMPQFSSAVPPTVTPTTVASATATTAIVGPGGSNVAVPGLPATAVPAMNPAGVVPGAGGGVGVGGTPITSRISMMSAEPSEALASSKSGGTTKTKKRQKSSQLKDAAAAAAAAAEPSQKRFALAETFGYDSLGTNFKQGYPIQGSLQQNPPQQISLTVQPKYAEDEYKEFMSELEGNVKEAPLKCDARHVENVWAVMELREDIEALKKYASKVSSAMVGMKKPNLSVVQEVENVFSELDKDGKCSYITDVNSKTTDANPSTAAAAASVSASNAANNSNSLGGNSNSNEKNNAPSQSQSLSSSSSTKEKTPSSSSLWREKCHNPHRKQRVKRVSAVELVDKIKQKKVDNITELVQKANESDAVFREIYQRKKQMQQMQQAEAQRLSLMSSRGGHSTSTMLLSSASSGQQESKPRSKHRSQHGTSQGSSSKSSQKGQSGEPSKRHTKGEDPKGSGMVYENLGYPSNNSEIGIMGQGAGEILNPRIKLKEIPLTGQGYIQTAPQPQQIAPPTKSSHKRNSQSAAAAAAAAAGGGGGAGGVPPQQPHMHIYNDPQKQANLGVTQGKDTVHKEHQRLLHKKMEHQYSMSNGNIDVTSKSQSISQKRSMTPQAQQKAQLQQQQQLQQNVGENLQKYGAAPPPPPQINYQPGVLHPQQVMQPKIEQMTRISAYAPTFQPAMISSQPSIVMGPSTTGIQMVPKK